MRAPSKTVDRARRLRRVMTLPEAILRRELRRGTLAVFRFRRQHPLGPYGLDFYCPEARLALEVDGAAHDGPIRAAQDDARTAWLAERGIRVLRLPARDVLRGDDAAHVLPTIAAACAELVEDPARPLHPRDKPGGLLPRCAGEDPSTASPTRTARPWRRTSTGRRSSWRRRSTYGLTYEANR